MTANRRHSQQQQHGRGCLLYSQGHSDRCRGRHQTPRSISNAAGRQPLLATWTMTVGAPTWPRARFGGGQHPWMWQYRGGCVVKCCSIHPQKWHYRCDAWNIDRRDTTINERRILAGPVVSRLQPSGGVLTFALVAFANMLASCCTSSTK